MTDPISAANPSGEINPFPSSFVAQVAQIGADTVTIPTEAIRASTREMDDYLATTAANGSAGNGRVLAVIGDYGSGKSHLAFHLVGAARTAGGRTVQDVYLNAPADTFVGLYRQFASKLRERKEVVAERVRRLYAEVVAESLENSPAHERIRTGLLNDELDPKIVVREQHWPESLFLEQVQERLRKVTTNKAFSTALTLLMRGGFDDAVWEWFLGNDPDEILKERGITDRTTGQESTALEAMGVFALLIAHGRNRFVVVVDELDQLLSASSRPDGEVQVALKKLLSVFVSGGAFLVLAGLPDFLNALRQDTRERITREVRMTALTADDTTRYIRERQERELGVNRLNPFTDETVRYLVDVAGGFPRQIVALCYYLYRRAMDEGGLVTDSMVRAVARERLYARSTDSMNADIKRIITGRGLTYSLDRYVGGTRVSYYVPIGELQDERMFAGALLVTTTVLDNSQLERVVGQINEVRAVGDVDVQLIVAGYIPTRYYGQLREALGRDPLVYDNRRFGDHLDAELKSIERHFERLSGGEPVDKLLARVDRMGQQLANTQGLVLRMASHLDTVAATSEQRLADVQRQLGAALEALGGTPAVETGTAIVPGVPLPEDVAAVFTEALGLLDVPRRVAQVMGLAFRATPESPSARRLLRQTLRHQQTHVAAGVSMLLQTMTEAFRETVADWYRQVVANEDGIPSADDLAALSEIGKTFVTLLEHLPVYAMDDLADFDLATEPGPHGVLDESLRSSRRAQTATKLDRLSDTVQAGLLAALVHDPGRA